MIFDKKKCNKIKAMKKTLYNSTIKKSHCNNGTLQITRKYSMIKLSALFIKLLLIHSQLYLL